MKRPTFLLIASIGQLFFGVFFLFFPEIAASSSLVDKNNITDVAMLFERNLGVFSTGFGIITFMSRKSEDNIALRAIFLGTLFYLIASVCTDAYAIINGLFTPQGWGGIGFRLLFIVGYCYYLAKMKIAAGNK
jgi:hypothetical protein